MNERSRALADLAVCPSELSVLDPNAPVLWVKFLRRTGLPMSAKSKRGQNAATDLWVDNNCKRAFIIRSFGLPASHTAIVRCKRRSIACSRLVERIRRMF